MYTGTKLYRIVTLHYLAIIWLVRLLKTSHLGYGCAFCEFQIDYGLSSLLLIKKIILFLADNINPEKNLYPIQFYFLLSTAS